MYTERDVWDAIRPLKFWYSNAPGLQNYSAQNKRRKAVRGHPGGHPEWPPTSRGNGRRSPFRWPSLLKWHSVFFNPLSWGAAVPLLPIKVPFRERPVNSLPVLGWSIYRQCDVCCLMEDVPLGHQLFSARFLDEFDAKISWQENWHTLGSKQCQRCTW